MNCACLGGIGAGRRWIAGGRGWERESERAGRAAVIVIVVGFGCGMRGPKLLAAPTRVGEVGTGDEGSGWDAFASYRNPLRPLTVVGGSESTWALHAGGQSGDGD